MAYTKKEIAALVAKCPKRPNLNVTYGTQANFRTGALNSHQGWQTCREYLFTRSIALGAETWWKTKRWDLHVCMQQVASEKVATDKLYFVSKVLAGLEKKLDIPEHKLKLVAYRNAQSPSIYNNNVYWSNSAVRYIPRKPKKAAKPKLIYVFTVELDDLWRYSPAMFFLVTKAIRSGVKTKAYGTTLAGMMRSKFMQMVTKHGIVKSFYGRSTRRRLQDGEILRGIHGLAHYTRNALTRRSKELNEEAKEAGKKTAVKKTKTIIKKKAVKKQVSA